MSQDVVCLSNLQDATDTNFIPANIGKFRHRKARLLFAVEEIVPSGCGLGLEI